MPLTEEQKETLYEKLIGTPDIGIVEAEELGVELEDVEAAMVDCGAERCSLCDWWCHDYELEGDPPECDSCRDGTREEEE